MSAPEDILDLEADEQLLVEPGTYTAKLVACKRTEFKGHPKLRLNFELFGSCTTDTPPVVFRHFNLPNPGQKLSRRCSVVREFVRISERLPRVSIVEEYGALVGQVFVVAVDTVKQDHAHNDLPELCQYSKVAALLEVVRDSSPKGDTDKALDGNDIPF